MKKRLLCIFLAVSMIGSSMTVFAAEQGDQLAAQTPASEEFTDEGEEGQEKEAANPDASAEPAVTPETVPGEEPDGMPEETMAPDETPAQEPEATPTGEPEATPTQEPEVTPGREPVELPDESPSPEASATPSMTPLVDEGIMSIAEDEELVGAGAGWVDGWIGGDNPAEVTLQGSESVTPSGGTAGIKENGTLNLNRCDLTVINNGAFECNGKLVAEGVSSIKSTYFTLGKKGSILIKKNSTLTVKSSATFEGEIVLEEGATLEVEEDAFFQTRDETSGIDIDTLPNVSGNGTVIVTGQYNAPDSKETEGAKYGILSSTVNEGVTFIVKGGLVFGMESNKAWHLQGGGKVVLENVKLVNDKDPDGIGEFSGLPSQRWTITGNTTLEMYGKDGGDIVYNGRDLIVNTGAHVKVHGNFSYHSGRLILNGGEVHIAGDYKLDCRPYSSKTEYRSGILEMNDEASTLIIDGDFIKASRASNYCAAGAMRVSGNIYLEMQKYADDDKAENPNDPASFVSGEKFKLYLDGDGKHKISSVNPLNSLNLAPVNNPTVDINAPMKIAIVSDGSITPVDGTLALTDSLRLNGHNVTINGNVEASKRVELGAGGRLEVTGNYTQLSDYLKIGDYKSGSGEVVIGGDFRMQGKDANGNYCTGDGGLIMENTLDKLTVNGNVYMESENVSGHTFYGTMTVKGNIDQKDVGEKSNFRGNKGFTLVLAGDGPQTVSLESSNSILNNLDIRNQNDVTVKGYLNANIVSDGSISLPADGTLEITNLKIQNHKLEIKGDADSVLKASGSVILEGLDSYLIVPGDYMQSSGTLRIGEGQMEVGGDLLLHDKDENGNRITGDGYLAMVEEEGRLTVKGDMIVQSTRDTNLSKGTIILSGDLIQKKGEDGSGTGDIKASASHKVVLAGDGPQNIQLESEGSKLGTLELTKDPSNYEFDPSDVSIKVTTGETPTPRPTTGPTSKPTTGPTSKPTSEPPSGPSPTAGPAETPAPVPQPTPSSGPYDWPFSDVSVEEGSWRYESVKYVYEKGVMNGISGTTRFAPNEPLTRGMFATVLYRMAGEPEVAFRDQFQDVQEGRYYDKAIIWANDQGIVGGLDGGTRFAPEEFITREQIAKMLYEYGRYQGYAMDESADLGGFPDNSDVSGWAVDYMKWAVGSGMINGKNIDNAHYLDPRGNASRVECAAMLTRFMTRYM